MESDIDEVYCMYFRTIPKKTKGANLSMFSPFKTQALILLLGCLTIGQNCRLFRTRASYGFPVFGYIKEIQDQTLNTSFP